MTENTNIEEVIELFVKGKLNGSALSDFQNLRQADESVAREVNLQQMTVKAIVENRRLALKSRLESLNIGGATVSTHPSTFARYFSLKSAAVVVATVGVGVSAYFFTQSQIDLANASSPQSNATLILDSAVQEVPIMVDGGEVVALVDEEYEAKSEPIAREGKPSNVADAEKSGLLKKQSGKSSLGRKSRAALANGEEMLNQKFEDGNESEIRAQIVPLSAHVAVEESKLKDIDIKNVQDGKHSLHYMLKESTLFLYGNFDATPYEILEFNEKEGQSIYLYYGQSFFSLRKGQTEPVKLKKIVDSKLVLDLTEARNKKH